MLNSRSSPPTLMFVVALSAFSTSCWFRKTPRTFTPPPPQAQPKIPATAAPIAAKPPAIEGDPTGTIPNNPVSIPEIPAPAAPKPTQKKISPTPTPVKPTPTNPPPEPPPSARLTPMYTPDEQRQYNRAIDDSLNRVKRALDSLSRKNLNNDQQVEVGRITTFQKQAEQAREAQ